MVRLAVVVGNPRGAGRTSQAGVAVAKKVSEALPGPGEIVTIDLLDHASRIFDPADAHLRALTDAVAGMDLVVFASPTYKASFTGLLKAFLDRYGSGGLDGVVAVPVMLGASPVHALAAEVHLRPVLVELGAVVPSTSVFVVDSEMDRLAETIDAWWDRSGPKLLRALGIPPPRQAEPPGA